MAYAAKRAETVYTSGPETLTASSSGIVAGPVSNYSKQVLATSEPPGPDAIPLKWIVSGRLENPTTVKGPANGPAGFGKEERSGYVEDGPDTPAWEQDYGYIQPYGQVVLFAGSDPANPIVRAIASGDGELDLAGLVRDIVAIQNDGVTPQLDGWLGYLNHAPTDHGRQAAIRSLVQMNADWRRIQPAIDRVVGTSSFSEQMRGFALGSVVFGLTHEKWKQDQIAVAEFLGRQFDLAGSAKLALQYVLLLKVALRYTMEEASREDRQPVRKPIVDALKRGEPMVTATPQGIEQYRDIRANYPGLL